MKKLSNTEAELKNSAAYTALEIRKNGRPQKIAVIYVLLDGSSAAEISTCVFCCFDH